MKDILDQLNNMFESIYNSVTGSSHDSGDPLLDEAWQDLDAYLKNNTNQGQAAFRDLDKEFAAFDQKFGTPNQADFETLKRQARTAQAASGHNQDRTYQQNQRQQHTAEDPLLSLARELVRDYHNLEIKPGAKADEVKAAYKKLIKQYHPDRFANDPEKQKTATTITAKLNQSYARIMEHLGQH